ncbi:MAG: hypothetical protein CMI78_00505 [Candidatus Pelagibacter sp.]|nr:hypothetical protein [Candidatus Pelagibacter sp.]
MTILKSLIIKIAVIGAGLAGKQHINTILKNKNCELGLIVDPSQEAYEISRKLNIQYFSSIQSALDKAKPDGTIICTPNSDHKEHAELFLNKKYRFLLKNHYHQILKVLWK